MALLTAPVSVSAHSGYKKYIVILGAPGAGKAANAEWMSKAYDIPLLDVRKALRVEINKAASNTSFKASMQHKRGTAYANRTKNLKAAFEKLSKGELVTSDSLNAIVASRVLSEEAGHGFVLDGYPATPEHAAFLDSIMEARGMMPLKVIYLDVSDDIAMKRMKENDGNTLARERMKLFNSLVGPVNGYRKPNCTKVTITTCKP